MRILINASVSGHVMNGFLVYCLNLLRALLPLLKAKGYDVCLVIPRGSILEELDVPKKYLPAICGMPKKRSPINPICRLLFNMFVLPFYTHRGDIVYALTPHGSFWGPGRQILTLHDLIPLEFPSQHRLQYYYNRYFLPWMLRHSEKVICISRTTRDLLMRRFKQPEEKLSVIYNGCSEDFRPVDGAADLIRGRYGVSDYLLACGVGFPHKNIKFLIETYAQLDKEFRRQHPLVIVGINTDAYAQGLMAMTRGLPCAADVHFVGMVPQEVLPALYSAARLFVYPTLSEGFGMPPVESMRCGTPCIVSDLPILREILGMHDARYFNPQDQTSLSVCLMSALEQSKDKCESGVVGDRYSWAQAATAVLAELENMR